MLLIDVRVLVYAHREDSLHHAGHRDWLTSLLNSDQAYAISDIVLSGFLRIVTHPRIFQDPSPLDLALSFTTQIRERPNCVLVTPGDRHWTIFTRLCQTVGAKGNLIPDAFLAALAIESGMEWVTTDRDYSRFPGLRWRHPLG